MKTKLLLMSLAVGLQASAQVVISEDFASGIPSGWNVSGSSPGASWQYNDSLDEYGGGCIIVNLGQSSTADSTTIELPSVRIDTLSDPYITFSAATVRANFISPELSLWYKDNSVWKKAETWGFYPQGGGVSTRETFSGQPLTLDNIEWVHIQYSLKPFRNIQNVQFAFRGDLLNGGWLLLDSVNINNNSYPVAKLPMQEGFEGTSFMPTGWQRKGPDYLADWLRNDSTGAFGASNACANFNSFWSGQPGEVYELQSPWFEITGSTQPSLTFDYAYTKNPNTLSDGLSIWYQVENRQWILLEELSKTELQTAPDQIAQFIPNSRQWMQKTLQVPVQGFQSKARIAFRYRVENGFLLYMDNVSIRDAVSVTKPEGKNYSIYPNPAEDEVYIDLNSEDDVTIEIYTITGQRVKELSYVQHGSRVKVDISSFSSGTYIVQVKTHDNTDTMQLLVK